MTLQYKKERSITENKDYYVVDNKGCSVIDFFWGDGWLKTPVDDIEEVLAPVPSYDRVCRLNHLEGDFIKAHERINKLEKENAKLHKFLEEFNALDVAKENKQLKELLKDCRQQLQEVELYRYDVDDIDQEDWFRISTEQAGIANKMKIKIDEVFK